jgi:hypothetical protein
MLQLAAPVAAKSVAQQLAPIAIPLAKVAMQYAGHKLVSKIDELKSRPKNGNNNKNKSSIVERRTRTSSAPVALSNVVSNQQNPSFRVTQARHPQLGDGVAIEFITFISTVRSNGVVANADYRIPFDIAGFDASANSGFITVDNTNVSGYKIYPSTFGWRLQQMSELYQRFRFRSLDIDYIPTCTTSQTGQLTLAFTEDPVQFIESGGTASAHDPDLNILCQTMPNVTTQMWQRARLRCAFRDKTLKYLSNTKADTTVSNTSYGDMAFIRSNYSGRIAGLLNGVNTSAITNYGSLWASGVVEFFGPAATNLTVAGLWGTNAFADEKKISRKAPKFLYCRGRSSWQCHPLLSSDKEEPTLDKVSKIETVCDEEKSKSEHVSDDEIEVISFKKFPKGRSITSLHSTT